MKVRCLDNEGGRYPLTIHKVYEVIKHLTNEDAGSIPTYLLVNDKGIEDEYFAHRFEVVQDATKRVKCVIPITGHLTSGKWYDVVETMSQDYRVRDDTGNIDSYIKSRFAPEEVVEPTTKEAPTLPASPQDPPFDFDAYNGIKPLRKVHIP